MPPNGNLQSLPAEIKLKVLQLLSLRDLRTVNRVSRDLREATNDPRLWRSLTLILTSRTWPDFREIIRLQKLKLITSVKFEQNISSKKAEETLRLLVKHGGITSLNLSGSKLSDVSKGTLKALLDKTKVLWVQNCRFTESQVNIIFQQISEGESDLEMLYISNNRLTGARANLLRGAVFKLSVLHCDNTNLCPSQITEMLWGIREAEDLRLKEINLNMNTMTPIDNLLLSESLSRIMSVKLYGCEPILVGLLNSIYEGQSNIEQLDIGDNDLTVYPPAFIAGAITKCAYASLYACEMNKSQISFLINEIKTQDNLRLKHLKLSGRFTDEEKEIIESAREFLNKFEFFNYMIL